MTKGIAEARTRAPHARILVIGYGTYLPPGGCVDVFGGALTVEEFTYVQGQIDRMSDTLARVAKQQEVDFVDMRRIPGSLEHTACAPPNQQWIRALDTYSDGATLHPSGCGMAAMAQHLTRTLQELEGWPLTPFDDSCVSAGPGAPSPSGEPSPSTPTSSTTPSTSPSGSPTGTVTPTATATPSPTVDPKEQQKARRAALRAEAKTLRLNATCRDGRVHVRLRGRVRHVARAVFSVAGELRGIDKTAPWGVELTDAPGTVRGTARAVVTLRDDGVRVRRTVKDATPRCPRR